MCLIQIKKGSPRHYASHRINQSTHQSIARLHFLSRRFSDPARRPTCIGKSRPDRYRFAAAARLPAVYGFRDHVDAGGLISYGVNYPENFRRAAIYVIKILNGAKPSDLPVEFPNKLELVINLKAAKALGLDIPPTLLARADEVIE
jgi:hypothetical protein